MDPARAAVQQTLAEVKAFLAQEASPHLSEADTKAYFVEPIIRALGWEGLGAVTWEYYVRDSQEFIDYVLRGDRGLLMAIEAKKLHVDLTDKHAAQLVQYCAVEGIEWAALTNGRELHFFNTFLKRDLAAKRVMQLDLLAFNSAEEFEAVFAQLWQLSRERMTAPSGLRTWMHQRRMDATLRQILTNPVSPSIGHLQAALTGLEVTATAQDLVQWFRAAFGDGPAVICIPPGTGGTVKPTAGSGEKDDARRVRPPSPPTNGLRGRLWPLLEAGLLSTSARLVLLRGKQVVAEASIDADGMIVLGGQSYRSPSDKDFAGRLGRQSLNGWREWRVESAGGRVALDDLRQRLGLNAGPEDMEASG